MLRLTILRQASADDAVEGGEVAEAPELGGIYVVLMSRAGHKLKLEFRINFQAILIGLQLSLIWQNIIDEKNCTYKVSSIRNGNNSK